MRGSSRAVPAIAAALCRVASLAMPPSATSSDTVATPRPTAGLAAYAGTWTHVESADEAAARERAIDRAADDFPFIARAVGRMILHRRIKPRDRYEFIPDEGDGTLRVRKDDEPVEVLRLDGGAHEFPDEDGEVITRSSHISDGVIETRWQLEDTSGKSVYRVSREGDAMVVEITVEREQFSSPLVYQTTYRRSDSVAAPSP